MAPLIAQTEAMPQVWLVVIVALVVFCALALWARRWRRYQTQLSRRYLFSRFSALAAFLSITFGVAVILIVLSIMGGYIDRLRDNLRGQESHAIIYSHRLYGLTDFDRVAEVIRSVEGVKGISPFAQILAMYRSGGFKECQIRGIDPRSHLDVTGFGAYTLRNEELKHVLDEMEKAEAVEGDAGAREKRRSQTTAIKMLEDTLARPDRAPLTNEEYQEFFKLDFRRQLLKDENPSVERVYRDRAPPPSVLVGAQLLIERQMFLGQIVNIVTIEPGTSNPVHIPLLVAGVFKTGTFESDSSLLYTDVRSLRNKLNLYDPKTHLARYEGVQVSVHDLKSLPQTIDKLEVALGKEFPALGVLSWEQLKRTTILAIEIEKFVIYFLLVLLVGFTACMVLLMLLLTVIEKTRDIGILLALGATPSGVVAIFLINGLILTLAGTVTGLGGGYLFCSYINPIHDWIYELTGIHLFPPDVYDMDRIPIAFRVEDALLSVAPALLLGFLASLIPAIWASRRDPIKAIHYE